MRRTRASPLIPGLPDLPIPFTSLPPTTTAGDTDGFPAVIPGLPGLPPPPPGEALHGDKEVPASPPERRALHASLAAERAFGMGPAKREGLVEMGGPSPASSPR